MPDDSFPIKGKPLKWLMGHARTARFWILISVGAGLASGLLLILQARIISTLVHRAILDGLSKEVAVSSLITLSVVILFRSFFAWAKEISGFQTGALIRTRLRRQIMEHLLSLGPARLHRIKTGALAATALEQVEALNNFYSFYLPQVVLAVVVPAAILVAVFPVSWAAGGIFLLTAPLIPLFMVLVGMGAESISQRNFQAMARLSGRFLDLLQGLPTLKLWNRGHAEKQTVAKVSKDYRKQTLQVLRVAFLSSAVMEFFSCVAIALVAVYIGMGFLGYLRFGSYGVPLSLSSGLFILMLAPDFYAPLRELGTHYHARAEAVGAAEEILNFFSLSKPPETHRKIELQKVVKIGIRFQDVCLSFQGGRSPVLDGIQFNIEPGQQVALVGASGAGKSTLLSLLLCFLTPDGGDILINDVNLETMDPEAWRKNIAWLGPEPLLFEGTIRENIRFGRPAASDSEFRAAVEAAHVLEFTDRLPGGLDTDLGEGGQGISRGQAQRVALARAFLKNAPLLLLDEPVASLDKKNEKMVLDGVRKLSEGKTVLMATHRLDGLERVSGILVLAEGRIVEQGTYGELMGREAFFAGFVRRSETEADND